MSKKATKKVEGDILSISFTTGQELVANLADIPQDMVHRLAMHGLSQKVGDAYAAGEVAEAFDRASGVLKDLMENNWSSRVAASGPRSTQLAEALAMAQGRTIEEAAAVIEQLDEEQIKGLRKHPQIKVKLAEIRQRNAAADVAKAAAAAEGAAPLEF